MTGFSNAFVAVRDLDLKTGGPAVLGAWDVTYQDAGWYTLYP